MVIVEEVLVLGQPTYTPKMMVLKDNGVVWGLVISEYAHITPHGVIIWSGYSDNAYGDSSFGVGDGDNQGVVSPRRTHLTSQKVGFCIDGNDFVSYESRYYSYMSRSEKYWSYSSSYISREDHYISSGDDGGGVGPSTKYFSSPKNIFGRQSHDMGFSSSYPQRKADYCGVIGY